jgi:cysteine dioxygenase
MFGTLEALIAYLDRLPGRPPLDELARRLRLLSAEPPELARWVRFGEKSYQRNLIRAGDHYHLWLLCWRNGQRSPIHDHTGSACAVRVIAGTATVSLFERAPNGLVKAVGSRDYGPGEVLLSADDDLHQVSNLQAGNADLITLHIYTPPLLRMGTYSITEPTRGEEIWELIGGAGI